jgi:hypothetical protein
MDKIEAESARESLESTQLKPRHVIIQPMIKNGTKIQGSTLLAPLSMLPPAFDRNSSACNVFSG